jgi:hypothetical protein
VGRGYASPWQTVPVTSRAPGPAASSSSEIGPRTQGQGMRASPVVDKPVTASAPCSNFKSESSRTDPADSHPRRSFRVCRGLRGAGPRPRFRSSVSMGRLAALTAAGNGRMSPEVWDRWLPGWLPDRAGISVVRIRENSSGCASTRLHNALSAGQPRPIFASDSLVDACRGDVCLSSRRPG